MTPEVQQLLPTTVRARTLAILLPLCVQQWARCQEPSRHSVNAYWLKEGWRIRTLPAGTLSSSVTLPKPYVNPFRSRCKMQWIDAIGSVEHFWAHRRKGTEVKNHQTNLYTHQYPCQGPAACQAQVVRTWGRSCPPHAFCLFSFNQQQQQQEVRIRQCS